LFLSSTNKKINTAKALFDIGNQPTLGLFLNIQFIYKTPIMSPLKQAIKKAQATNRNLPFAIYTSAAEQRIYNIPITTPTLMVVLSGEKKLGKNSDIRCPEGNFIFLSTSPRGNMRNIPSKHEYLAIIIEFEFKDFEFLQQPQKQQADYLLGKLDSTLEQTLHQFIEWSQFAPESLWPLRRQEILQLLFYQGYDNLYSIVKLPGIAHKVHQHISNHFVASINIAELCNELNMSESSLRRKLNAEGTSIQEIKDQIKLALALHLLQTTFKPIGVIANHCGFQSQSRFTAKFKSRFGLTPSDLRKTRVIDSG